MSHDPSQDVRASGKISITFIVTIIVADFYQHLTRMQESREINKIFLFVLTDFQRYNVFIKLLVSGILSLLFMQP